MNQITPLLLLPGLMNDARVWSPVMAALAGGRNVLVAPTHLRDSIAATARDAIASMPPGTFAVAGFSLGGYVAQEVCRQAADRIAGVALVDSGARADSEETKQVRRRMIEAVGAGGSAAFGQVAEGFADRIVHPSRRKDREFLRLLADMAASVGGEGFVRQQQAAIGRADMREWLPGLRGPALVVCGREDQVTPLALSQEMASLLPDAELVVVEQAGHMSILEQPGVVVPAVLRWLGRVDAAGEQGRSSRAALLTHR